MRRSEVVVVGCGRTPYARPRANQPTYTIDEYVAWAAELALTDAGMTKNDFNGQGLGIAHAEASHTVNWSATVAENLGISPRALLRADQGGASAGALLGRAAALISAGVIDRALIVGADTPFSSPSVAPGLPLSPERIRGPYWDFQGPFGVMGANGQFALVQQRYQYEHGISDEILGRIAVVSRYHASLNPMAIYRTPIDLDEYLASRILTDPIRLLDCVPLVNGGLAYIVCSSETADRVSTKPVFLRGIGEVSNFYAGSRTHPDITTTGFVQAAPEAFAMAGIAHADVDLFLPYDDYPMVVALQVEDYGFCGKGDAGAFLSDRSLAFDGDFPISTDGGQLSGGQPGGAIGGFMPIVEAVTQLRGDGGQRQVPSPRTAVASGFGGMSYARNNRSCVAMAFSVDQ